MDEANRWIREICWTSSETESRLAIEKAFDDEKLTNSCFNWDESKIKIIWKLVTDTLINWKMRYYVETLMLMCQRSEGVACLVWVSWHLQLHYGFQCYRCKTICFVEVTGSNANNATAWRETFGVEDAWTFTTRDWTQHDNPPNGQIVEKGMRSDEKLCYLAKGKCAVEGLLGAHHDPWVFC